MKKIIFVLCFLFLVSCGKAPVVENTSVDENFIDVEAYKMQIYEEKNEQFSQEIEKKLDVFLSEEN